MTPQRKSQWNEARQAHGNWLVWTILGVLVILTDLVVFLTRHVVVPLIVTARSGEAFDFSFSLLEVGIHALFLLVGLGLIKLDAAKALGAMLGKLPMFGKK
jgi:hypothetical protein